MGNPVSLVDPDGKTPKPVLSTEKVKHKIGSDANGRMTHTFINTQVHESVENGITTRVTTVQTTQYVVTDEAKLEHNFTSSWQIIRTESDNMQNSAVVNAFNSLPAKTTKQTESHIDESTLGYVSDLQNTLYEYGRNTNPYSLAKYPSVSSTDAGLVEVGAGATLELSKKLPGVGYLVGAWGAGTTIGSWLRETFPSIEMEYIIHRTEYDQNGNAYGLDNPKPINWSEMEAD